MKRTNIVIDDKKLAAIRKSYGLKTTREIVDFALSELIRSQDKKDILRLKGQMDLDLDLDELRSCLK